MKQITLKEFVERANKIHNYKFDYSLVSISTPNNKIQIICPDHGIFSQLYNSHLSGNGCKKCAIEITAKANKITTEEFVSRSNIIHNYKFDYSLVNIHSSIQKIDIICPHHGIFNQHVSSHLSGTDCPACKNVKKLSTEEFIKRGNEKYNFKFDYSLVIYKKNSIKVSIICPEHGIFYQRPNDHLSPKAIHACPKCSDLSMNNNRNNRLTLEIFKFRSEEIHGKEKYLYDKTKFLNVNTKVVITCIIHGDFKQIPTNHLKGYGCPKCKISTGELPIKIFLEQNNIKYIFQKKFDDCKNPNTNKKLPFDFYLPDYNCCIEFDGQQHFIPYSFGSDKSEEKKLKNLQIIKHRDNIKNIYCQNQNLKLIRIPYYDGDKINQILKKELNI